MANQQTAEAGFAGARCSASYMGESPNQGTLRPGRLYPDEGFAVIKCGGTEIILGYTLLHHLRFELDGNSERWDEVAKTIKAFNVIKCEASLGRTPNPPGERPDKPA